MADEVINEDLQDAETLPASEPEKEVDYSFLDIVDPADEEEDLKNAQSDEAADTEVEEEVSDAGEDGAGDEEGEGDGDASGASDDSVDGDWLDPELLEFARERGLTELEARRFGSKERLEYAILEDLQKQQRGDGSADDDVSAQPGQKLPSAKLKLELDEDSFDPEVKKAIEEINEHYGQMTDEMVVTVAGLGQLLGDMVAQQEEGWFDARVNGLGEDYREIFGEGTGHTLKRGSAEWKARNDLLKEVRAHQKTHRNECTREESFERCLRALHGDKQEKQVRDKIRSSIQKRGKQMISRDRSNKRASTNPTGTVGGAIAAVRERMAQLGVVSDDE